MAGRGGSGRGGNGSGVQGMSRTYTLSYLMNTPNYVSLAVGNAVPLRGGGGGAPASGEPSACVASLVRGCCRAQRPTGASGGLFGDLCETWRRSVALAIPHLRGVARKSRFLSPVTGNVVEGPLAATAANGADGAGDDGLPSTSMATRQVYSFELRRMTILLTAATPTTSRSGGKEEGQPSQSLNGEPTATPSASASPAQAALHAALGLSYDYAKPPATAADNGNVVGGVREWEPASTRKRRRTAEQPAKAFKEGRTEEKTKHRRPGRKERRRLQTEREQRQQGGGGGEEP